MEKDKTTPINRRIRENTNGDFQAPVASSSFPNSSGEITPASPKPKFIMPLAAPTLSGAISIGIAHIGATINSEKKHAPERHKTISLSA